MALEKKVTKAILSTMKHLENSKKSIAENNRDALENQIWKASAELEYALFLFSILRQNEEQNHSWKGNLKSKGLEFAPVIASTQELLKKAQTDFENGNLPEAHKNIWLARGHLLKVQNFLEKKRQ